MYKLLDPGTLRDVVDEAAELVVWNLALSSA